MADSNPIPFSDPPHLMGLPSQYHKPTHKAFQKKCRAFMEEHLIPNSLEWEKAGNVPDHLYDTFVKANMLLPNLPSPLPVEWLKKLGIHDILGVKVEEWDLIHTSIYVDEMARSGLAGPGASMTAGVAYGIPVVIKYGSKKLQERFLPRALTGKDRWCIAITEPEAGSDVANITTTATKSKDGKHYIINGTKKWITNGIWSQYAAMAVRTGGKGAGGLSMVVCPLKGHEGVEMRRMKVGGQVNGGTTYITLDEVRIPVENLIGEEGQGMKYIMNNFNHERLTIAIGVTRQARVAVSKTVEYTLKREAFGKTLMDQPVVRHRLAKAVAELESLQAWVDQFVWQVTQIPKAESDVRLGGQIALSKAKAGMVFSHCAEVGVLLHGGNGFTKTGQGELLEAMSRDVWGSRIPGGSEDVMLDIALRQAIVNYTKAAKQLELRAKDGAAKL